MKKKLLYISAMLLGLAACNKEQPDGSVAGPVVGEGETLVRLTGKIAAPTKVAFDNVYGNFTWSESGDAIAIHVSKGERVPGVELIPAGYKMAAVEPNDPATTCDFYFVMNEFQRRDAFAVYPASISDENHYTADDLRVTLPDFYDIDPAPAGMGDWSPTPMVAVNDASSDVLTFRHVGGLLRLTLNDVSPATASIEVSLGKRLTGSFTVNDPDSAVPYIATDSEADVLTFQLSEPLAAYTDGFILNVPVPTGTYEMLSVKARNANGDVVYAYEDETVRSFDAGRGRRAETSISSIAIPLTIEAVEDGAVSIDNPMGLTMEYSLDNKNWTAFSEGQFYLPVEAGDCVYLRGNNASYADIDVNTLNISGTKIRCEGTCYLYGNIMSLIEPEGFDNLTELTEDFAFGLLFSGSSDFVNHPEKSLELPATTLSAGCYFGMFFGCSGLTVAPALPATTLAVNCYRGTFAGTGITRGVDLPAETVPEGAYGGMYSGCSQLAYAPDLIATVVGKEGYEDMFEDCVLLENAPSIAATEIGESAFDDMFKGCARLKEAPVLRPTQLAPECYKGMFEGCSSLEEAPELPVTELQRECYYEMFLNCTSLKNVPALPATELAEACYSYMFSGCTSLENAPAISAETLANRCCYRMFYGCTSLTSAPLLPVRTLAEYCYYEMFMNCTSLEVAPELPALELASYCYQRMFSGCSSLRYVKAMFISGIYGYTGSWLEGVASTGVFVKNRAATWTTTGSSGVPNGWTVQYADE